MGKIYHLAREYRDTAVSGLVLFGALFVSGLYVVTAQAPEAYKLEAFLAGVAPWFLGIAGSIWLLVCYRRETLTTHDGRIVLTGVFKSGRLVLKSSTAKVTISFGNYEYDERRQLVLFFRSVIAETVQHGWALFYHKHRSLLETPGQPEKDSTHGQVRLTRRVLDWCFVAVLIPTIPLAVLGWWFSRDRGDLAIPLVIALFWLSVRWQIPTRGVSLKKLSDVLRPTAFRVFAVSWVLLGFGTYVAYRAFEQRLTWPRLTLLAGVSVYVLVYLAVWLIERHRAAGRG